jgi:hypothetical protein
MEEKITSTFELFLTQNKQECAIATAQALERQRAKLPCKFLFIFVSDVTKKWVVNLFE